MSHTLQTQLDEERRYHGSFHNREEYEVVPVVRSRYTPVLFTYSLWFSYRSLTFENTYEFPFVELHPGTVRGEERVRWTRVATVDLLVRDTDPGV